MDTFREEMMMAESLSLFRINDKHLLDGNEDVNH